MSIIDVATRYLDALVSHDADSVPLADDACRINNGLRSIEGADALRAIIRREPAARTASFRWLVDGVQAITFYDLDADLKRGEGPVTSEPSSWVPAYIGERFQVRNGVIEEIEVVYTAGSGPRPERPDRHPEGSDTRDGVLAAARAYVDSLVSHDPSAVPLADDVWRIENGKNNAEGARPLRAALESDVMQSVQSIEDTHWFAGDGHAAVFYTLQAKVGERLMPMRIAERFRSVDGQLTEIEAIVAPVAKKKAD
jgi:hypothetical protein